MKGGGRGGNSYRVDSDPRGRRHRFPPRVRVRDDARGAVSGAENGDGRVGRAEVEADGEREGGLFFVGRGGNGDDARRSWPNAASRCCSCCSRDGGDDPDFSRRATERRRRHARRQERRGDHREEREKEIRLAFARFESSERNKWRRRRVADVESKIISRH